MKGSGLLPDLRQYFLLTLEEFPKLCFCCFYKSKTALKQIKIVGLILQSIGQKDVVLVVRDSGKKQFLLKIGNCSQIIEGRASQRGGATTEKSLLPFATRHHSVGSVDLLRLRPCVSGEGSWSMGGAY